MTKASSTKSGTIPPMAQLLGWGGVIPFLGCGLAVHTNNADLVLYGFVGGTSYAAVILTFLGAVHWGLAMSDNRPQGWFIWSTTPSLLAWASLLIFDVDLRLYALVPLFGLAWCVDRIAANQQLIPVRYMRLRTRLTIGAIAGLLLMML